MQFAVAQCSDDITKYSLFSPLNLGIFSLKLGKYNFLPLGNNIGLQNMPKEMLSSLYLNIQVNILYQFIFVTL